MPIQTQSADGVMHEFPDGTDSSVVDRVMKDYATKQQPTGLASYPHEVSEALKAGQEMQKSALSGPWYTGATNIAKYLGGGVQELMAPVTGATEAFIAKPIKRAVPGPVGEFVGNAAGDAASLVGGGGVAKGAAEAARLAGSGTEEAAAIASRLKPGAMKEAQAGVANIGPQSDVSTLGSKIYKDLSTRVNELTKARREEAAQLKAQYFSEGIAKEKAIADAYRNDLSATLKQHARDLSPEQKKLVQDSIDHIGKDPSIEAIETERRRLNDIASGATEGYDGIQKLFAGKMAANLSAQITRAVPSSGKFLSSYAEASGPINMFEDTALGRRITKGASDYLPDQPYFNPSDLPKNIFKDKWTIQNFKTLANDDRLVSGAASEYTASELTGKSAEQARAWVDKNKIWLDEVPDVQQEAEKYVSNLEKVTLTQERAAKAVKMGVLGGIAAEGYHRISNMMGW